MLRILLFPADSGPNVSWGKKVCGPHVPAAELLHGPFPESGTTQPQTLLLLIPSSGIRQESSEYPFLHNETHVRSGIGILVTRMFDCILIFVVSVARCSVMENTSSFIFVECCK